MRKIYILALVSLMFGLQVNAQKFDFGARAGLSFTNIIGDVEDVDVKTRYHVGGIAIYKLSNTLELESNLLLSVQGGSFDVEDVEVNSIEVDIVGDVDLYYINLPILLKAKVFKNLYAGGGISVSYLASKDYNYTVSALGFEIPGEDVLGYEDQINDFEFGASVDVGYKLNNKFLFDVRYNLGLTNIIKVNDRGIQNSVIFVSVGYLF